MTEQAIESRDITVTDIFQDFYRVPDYQREYVWKTEHVEPLLNDINASLGNRSYSQKRDVYSQSKLLLNKVPCRAAHGWLKHQDRYRGGGSRSLQ